MSSQRYVSNELTHFVGRSLENDDARYNLLAKIVRSGWLTHPPHDPTQPMSGDFLPRELLTADGLAQRCVICFCDIPTGDYAIYMTKYHMFGISFSKEFLVRKGASPVFYVATDSSLNRSMQTPMYTNEHMKERVEKAVKDNRYDRSLLFDTSATMLLYLISCYGIMIDDPSIRYETLGRDGIETHIKNVLTSTLGLDDERISRLRELFHSNEQASRFLKGISDFLLVYVFGFVKGFNSALPENHPNNFYMEREWRVLGNIQFTLNNIERVIFPRAYAERFRKDFPDYIGQVFFADAP